MRQGFMRAYLGSGLTVALLLGVGAVAAQEAFPVKPIRLIVPNPAGGSTDVMARVVAEHVDLGGYRIVVENMPGAAGQIAFEAVKNAPADGYTLAMAATGLTSGPFLMQSFTLDPVEDFTPISLLSMSSGLLISVHSSVPANTLEELIAYSKSNPEALNIGTPGGTPDLDIPLFKQATGMMLTSIPYQGQGPILQAIASGELQVMMDPPWSSAPLLANGTVRPTAVGTPERIPLVPEVPTLAESGVPDFNLTTTWFGVIAPKDLPEPVQKTLADAFAAALGHETVLARLNELGMRVPEPGPEAMAAVIASDMVRFAEGAQVGGIVPQ